MTKRVNTAITLVFLVLIFGFGITFWTLPDKDFSEEENRSLQTLPAVTMGAWLDGSVSGKLTSYYSDQFPLRPAFVGLHALCELGSGRGESNGVLLGEDGQLAVRRFDIYLSRIERLKDTDHAHAPHVAAGLDALVQLDTTLNEVNIPLCILLPPRTIDVAATDFSYPAILSNRLDAVIENKLGGSELNHINLLSTFREMHEAGDYVYYRTDHHWTTQGAYTAYVAVMKSWGMADEILPPEFFTVRTIENFYGTTYSRSGMFFVPPDTMEIWAAADGSDSHYTVSDADGQTVIEQGFIHEPSLEKKDKYAAFLDGTHRLLTITDTTAQDRPRLLLARDSFANSMVPFLARHFDIVMVNLSGGMTNLSDLAEAHNCDRVLVVCNRENLITSDCFVTIH